MPSRLILVIGVLAALTAAPASADVRRLCTISYETASGWSPEVDAEVSFMTGRELNTLTRSLEYHSMLLYALVSMDNRNVAVIRLDRPNPRVGRTFDEGDFLRYFRVMDEATAQLAEGRSQQWRIRAKRSGQFIDVRSRS